MLTNQTNKYVKPVFKLDVPDDSYKFQQLPAATGSYPYQLNVEDIVTVDHDEKMVFHMVGDTGSAKQPQFQRLVAQLMIEQFGQAETPASVPLFLFHLGDVVYHFGEAEEYFRQFFEPYKDYPAPIFAIAGNHDSDVNPNAKKPYKSLDAFVKVFCDTERRLLPLAQDSGRMTMVQPNIYYTLNTPLATIIALYSNVPKFGVINPEQKNWFIQQLKNAKAEHNEKALIICIHHAPYSADGNHGSSRAMIALLEDAFLKADVYPDIVFSGHVHNYQRFARQHADGSVTPYIVSGAGGYVTLFPLVMADGINYVEDDELLKNVTLQNYCDDKHGFLKVEITKVKTGLQLQVNYYTIPLTTVSVEQKTLRLADTFTIAIRRK